MKYFTPPQKKTQQTYTLVNLLIFVCLVFMACKSSQHVQSTASQITSFNKNGFTPLQHLAYNSETNDFELKRNTCKTYQKVIKETSITYSPAIKNGDQQLSDIDKVSLFPYTSKEQTELCIDKNETAEFLVTKLTPDKRYEPIYNYLLDDAVPIKYYYIKNETLYLLDSNGGLQNSLEFKINDYLNLINPNNTLNIEKLKNENTKTVLEDDSFVTVSMLNPKDSSEIVNCFNRKSKQIIGSLVYNNHKLTQMMTYDYDASGIKINSIHQQYFNTNISGLKFNVHQNHKFTYLNEFGTKMKPVLLAHQIKN